MSGLITMGLGPKQLLLTMGLGSPGGVLPPVVIRPKGGGRSYNVRRRSHRPEEEEENQFLEKWVVEVSGIDIYSKVEKEIDMRPNITIRLEDKEVHLDKDIKEYIQVSVERVRVNSE